MKRLLLGITLLGFTFTSSQYVLASDTQSEETEQATNQTPADTQEAADQATEQAADTTEPAESPSATPAPSNTEGGDQAQEEATMSEEPAPSATSTDSSEATTEATPEAANGSKKTNKVVKLAKGVKEGSVTLPSGKQITLPWKVLTPEEKKARDEASYSKSMTSISKDKKKTFTSALSTFEKQLKSIRKLCKKAKNSVTDANDGKDSMYGTVESRAKSIAMENVLHTILMVVKSFERAMKEYTADYKAEDVAEHNLQAKTAMQMVHYSKYQLALAINQLIHICDTQNGNYYNSAAIQKALSALQKELISDKSGDTVLSNYESLAKVAKDKELDDKDNAQLTFIKEGMDSARIVSNVFKNGLFKIINFVEESTQEATPKYQEAKTELLGFINDKADGLGINLDTQLLKDSIMSEPASTSTAQSSNEQPASAE